VWETKLDQVQFPAYAFGVTVHEFGGQTFHR
jgi:hypothetical protein